MWPTCLTIEIGPPQPNSLLFCDLVTNNQTAMAGGVVNVVGRVAVKDWNTKMFAAFSFLI